MNSLFLGMETKMTLIDKDKTKYYIISSVKTEKEKSAHYEYCQKNKYPFIMVKKQGKCYANISYDITNFDIPLEVVSERVKHFYLSYVEFVHIPFSDIPSNLDNLYMFDLVVKMDDVDFIASRLFDYLLIKINNG